MKEFGLRTLEKLGKIRKVLCGVNHSTLPIRLKLSHLVVEWIGVEV